MKIIDVFAGVGGFSLGAARAGFEVSAAIEIDKITIGTHKVNFPKSQHIEADVSALDGADLLSRLNLEPGGIDGLIGGPPCQGFSAIGHQCPNDSRSSLFGHFFRLVSEMKPKFYVAENVPGILASKFSNTVSAALSFVEDDYILLPPITFTASDYGAPTSRKRILFIGYRSDIGEEVLSKDMFSSDCTEVSYVKDAMRGLPDFIDPEWQDEESSWRSVQYLDDTWFSDKLINGVPVNVGCGDALRRLKEEKLVSGFLGTRHSPTVEARYGALSFDQTDRISKSKRLNPNSFCPTLRAGTTREKGSYQAVRPIHPFQPRVITPREAARMQGFPDWFQFHPTKWHSFRQIGNSISPILAEFVLSRIADAI